MGLDHNLGRSTPM